VTKFEINLKKRLDLLTNLRRMFVYPFLQRRFGIVITTFKKHCFDVLLIT